LTEELLCRLEIDGAEIKAIGPLGASTDINTIIVDDKRYGKMVPRNGEYFTFRILDVNDKEIDDRFVDRAVKLSFMSYTKRFNIEAKKARNSEYADFKVMFRTPENDERHVMTKSTIMYHYFPIADFRNPKRGLCVINPNFWFTDHGNSIPMWMIDPVHYDENSTARGPTIDFDGTYRHELGHGWGLPHDPEPNTTMSTPYSKLREFLDERTIFRMIKKYGMKKISPRKLVRWLRYIWARSERFS